MTNMVDDILEQSRRRDEAYVRECTEKLVQLLTLASRSGNWTREDCEGLVRSLLRLTRP